MMAEIALILTLLASGLQSDRFAVRERAHQGLLRAGWLAEPALQLVALSGDIEASYRARSLLESLPAEKIHAPTEAEEEPD